MKGYTSAEVGQDISYPSPFSLRERYFCALRARKALCEPDVCMEKTKLVVDFDPHHKVHSMGFTISGDIFWVFFDQRMELFDLRGPKIIAYNIELSSTDYRPMWPVVEMGRWRDEEGVILAAGSL
ncbi:hypothetical protein DL93DRAFT_2089748 [Clavulina sp. PMI_390]|nr:hypothetical protein DL93DRAFT_2089748 [Clavulina sp. PMI_390]